MAKESNLSKVREELLKGMAGRAEVVGVESE
jgi:hypothetical protein